ncbi:MAG: N-6 DNA methylase, partial [Pelolinea sp.]|nr:N-6 DNA methylase [Pelolinea sp.]
LVPEELFNKSKLDELLEYQDANGSTYYKAILQNLFFATLNQEMNTLQKPNNRKFRNRTNNSYGRDQNRLITTLFRYEGYFQNPQAALELFSTIPFLNGGLFECLDKEIERDGKKEIIRIDGFTDEKKNSLTVPDELFFCKKRNIDLSDIYPTKSKKDEVRGLLHILDSYKFTIEENTPVEEEVALDPELLGKVFENLLAAYNPETRSSARKATGSYYTPREIVDYMVSESLIAYLETKLDEKGKGFGKSSKPIVPTQQKLISEGKSSLQVPLGNESRLRNLLEYNHNPHQFNESEVNVLINAIDQITVLDPACGSGAFPMGMLHKLVFALSKLDENNEKWKKRQLEKAQEFEDVQAKEQSIKGIEEAFAENELNYGRKLFLIENCIYGVDIQPIAVQIAKLRLFISLVVDQKISEKKYNRGMRALPNLETKFVAANTLIGLEKPLQPGLEATEVVMMLDEKEKELKGVRHKLFLARTPDSKRNYRYKDKTIRGQIKDLLLTQGWKRESADMLANWDPFNQSNSSGFFDSEWMMGVKEGFNVIIANPPYIGEKGNEKIFQEVAKNNLGKQFYTRWMDYFYFFFHTGINLCKTDGTISFITTNYFLTATGADKLRTDLRNRTIVKQIINFNELKVFDTALGQHNSIIILQKGQDKNAFANNCITNRQGSITQEVLRRILDKKDSETIFFNVKQKDLYDGKPNYIRLNGNSISSVDPIQNILNKINNNAPTLNSFCNINQGIVSGADKVSNRHLKKYSDLNAKKGDGIYVLSKREISELDIPDYDYEKFVKPFYKNSDIKKYYTKNKNDYWVLYIRGQGKPIKLSSQLREHFEKYRVLLTAVKSNFLKNYIARAIVQKWLDNGNYFVLFNPKKEYNFILPKIIAPQRSPINTFGYNEIPWYASADVYFITEKDKTVLLKYILALLNSKLYYLWLYHRGKRKGEMLELYQKPLSEIPIKKISKPDQNLFVSVVDKILLITQDEDFQNNPTKQAEVEALEREIDQMVYHLYGLTEEEIEIVEGKR